MDRSVASTVLVEAAGCLCECQNRLLYLRRSPGKLEGNYWNIPGGKLEPGETPVEAVIRELFEETGVQAAAHELTSYGELCIMHPSHRVRFHLFHLRLTTFPASITICSQEHQEWRWVTLEEAIALPLIRGGIECIEQVYGK